jgi:twitching motility protein PilU
LCLRGVVSQRLVRGVDGKLIPAVEILLKTSLIADLIKNDEIEKIRDAIEKSVSAGSQTFEQALYKLIKAGKITKEEAMRHADSSSNLSSLIEFSSNTKTAQHAAFDPNQGDAAPSVSDFSDIKLNMSKSK